MKRFRPRRRAPPTSLLVARLGLALGITLLFFLGLELGLWALGRIPALRTGPTEPVAFDDSWTLVFTGDSVTYGLELPSSSSYPAQLARFEATRIAKARVHNLALPGQSLDDIAQQIRTFQQAAEPDTPTRIVVLGGINDCLQAAPGPGPTGTPSSPPLAGRRKPLRSYSRTYRLLDQLLLRIRSSSDLMRPVNESAMVDHCPVMIDAGLHRIEQTAHTKPIFLDYPTPPAADAQLPTRVVNRILAETARSRGLDFIDLDACFQSQAGAALRSLFNGDQLHLTEPGATIVATCLAQELVALHPREP
jgi:lysophospholipase L1-like esterase